jgi:hypothetical protein
MGRQQSIDPTGDTGVGDDNNGGDQAADASFELSSPSASLPFKPIRSGSVPSKMKSSRKTDVDVAQKNSAVKRQPRKRRSLVLPSSSTQKRRRAPSLAPSVAGLREKDSEEGSQKLSNLDAKRPAEEPSITDVSEEEELTMAQIQENNARSIPLVIPNGHKLVHVMRHARAWHK